MLDRTRTAMTSVGCDQPDFVFAPPTKPVLNAEFTGTSGDDTIRGTNGRDSFDLSQGGDDRAYGGGAADTFYFGGALTEHDSVNGGKGKDTVELQGNYAAGLTISAHTLGKVEKLVLEFSHHDYRLAFDDNSLKSDMNLASGFVINGSQIGNHFGLNVDFTAYTHPLTAKIIGDKGNDTVNAGHMSLTVDFSRGGEDTFTTAHLGDFSHVYMGARLDAGDHIEDCSVELKGDYSAGFTFSPDQLHNIRELTLGPGNYKLALTGDIQDHGLGFDIDATALPVGDSADIDCSALTPFDPAQLGFDFDDGLGNDHVIGSPGGDSFGIANGADMIFGGAGNDRFVALDLNPGEVLDGGDGNDFLDLTLLDDTPLVLGGPGVVNFESAEVEGDEGTNENVVLTDGLAPAGTTFFLSVAYNEFGVDSTLDASAVTEFGVSAQMHGDHITFTGGSGDDIVQSVYAIDTANIMIDGGGGTNTFIGNPVADNSMNESLTLDPVHFKNIERVVFSGTLQLADGFLSAGETFTVDDSGISGAVHFTAPTMPEGARIVVLGGIEPDTFISSTGDDVFDGGGTSQVFTDTFFAGSGHDTLVYHDVWNSTGFFCDLVRGFDATKDVMDFPFVVAAIDPRVDSGELDSGVGGAAFNIELADAIKDSKLGADHAVVFHPDSGNLAGNTYLIVDANGEAGYQANEDYVIQFMGSVNLTLTTANFI